MKSSPLFVLCLGAIYTPPRHDGVSFVLNSTVYTALVSHVASFPTPPHSAKGARNAIRRPLVSGYGDF